MDISENPLLQRCYELCRAIEACGASPELTDAVAKASDLMRDVKALLEENARLRSNLRITHGALRQASSCLRELLPNDYDAKFTVGMINTAFALTPNALANLPERSDGQVERLVRHHS